MGGDTTAIVRHGTPFAERFERRHGRVIIQPMMAKFREYLANEAAALAATPRWSADHHDIDCLQCKTSIKTGWMAGRCNEGKRRRAAEASTAIVVAPVLLPAQPEGANDGE